MGYSGGKRGANGRSGHRRARAPALTARPARLAAAAAAVCVIASTGALPAAAQSAASDSGAWHNTLSYIQNLQWWDHSSAWGVNNVLDQSRPFNLKGGKRIGRFEFAPVLSARLIYDDNIFNRAQDRKGDYYAEIAPGLSVSTETARHFFNVTAGLKAYKYAKYDEFDALDRSINASAAFHVNSSHVIYATIGHALLHEDSLSYLFPDLDGTRQSRVTFNAAERTPVNATHGEAGIRRDGGRLHGALRARYGTWDYQDIRTQNGDIADQDYRDVRTIQGEASVGYRFSPGYELIGSFASTRLDFLNAASDYADGWRHEASIGLNFETGPLLSWQLSGGYAYRTFDDPIYEPNGAYTARLAVNWAATERLTLKAEARRQLSVVTTETGVGATLTHAVRANADFELYHNLIFTINGEYWVVDDQDSPARSNIYRAGAQLQFLSAQNWVASVGYDFIDQRSNEPDLTFKRNQFWGRVRIRF